MDLVRLAWKALYRFFDSAQTGGPKIVYKSSTRGFLYVYAVDQHMPEVGFRITVISPHGDEVAQYKAVCEDVGDFKGLVSHFFDCVERHINTGKFVEGGE